MGGIAFAISLQSVSLLCSVDFLWSGLTGQKIHQGSEVHKSTFNAVEIVETAPKNAARPK